MHNDRQEPRPVPAPRGPAMMVSPGPDPVPRPRRVHVHQTRVSLGHLCGGPGCELAGANSGGPGPSGEFTFVHLTDMHVTKRRQGHEGYKACVEAVRKHRPAFVLMGGDMP